MDSIPFQWGDHGDNWEAIGKNGHKIKMAGREWNSIYSSESFSGNKYDEISFTFKITQKTSEVFIGVTNNTDHKNSAFWVQEDSNRFYCIDLSDGSKSSHSFLAQAKHKKTKSVATLEWTESKLKLNKNDMLTFLVDFADESIWIYKNNRLVGKMYDNINDSGGKKDKKSGKGKKNRKNVIDWKLFVSGIGKNQSIEFVSCFGSKAGAGTSKMNAFLRNNTQLFSLVLLFLGFILVF